jgi:hypothetical protein
MAPARFRGFPSDVTDDSVEIPIHPVPAFSLDSALQIEQILRAHRTGTLANLVL